MERESFSKELIEKAKKVNIEIDNKKEEQFYNYMKLLLEWNEKINLTAIIEQNDIILKHFIDSITINKYIEQSNSIIDIGTGAGFPGIPLKIMNQNKKITLVDSLNKRINFLNEVCKEISLENIQCIHARAEELASDLEYRENYETVVSRAVARLNVLIEYMLPFVKKGGLCICMKGPNIDGELEEAKNAIKLLGGKIKSVESFFLPDSDIERNVIIIEKVAETPKKYPRKAGLPSKQPII